MSSLLERTGEKGMERTGAKGRERTHPPRPRPLYEVGGGGGWRGEGAEAEARRMDGTGQDRTGWGSGREDNISNLLTNSFFLIV